MVRFALPLLIVVSPAAMAGSPHKAGTPRIEGEAKVIEGDTINFHGTPIRLHLADSPELRQTCLKRDHVPYACGVAAKLHLEHVLWLQEARS